VTTSTGHSSRDSPPVPAQRAPQHASPMARRQPGIDPTTLATVLGLGALTVATWPLVVAAAGPVAPPVALLAHVAGMLAGYGVLVLLVLMARTPVLERGVGADVLARWHGILGRTVLALVAVHGTAAIAAWAQVTGTSAVVAGLQVLAMPWLVSATVGTVVMVAAGVMSARVARRRIRHETWHGLHLLMYLAVALSFGHMLAGPDLAGRPVHQVAWALAYTYVFALVIRFRVIQPLHQATRHRMRVADVRREGPGVVSIVVAGEHLQELNAEAGQFFRWRFLTPDHWRNAHPFSLSAPPSASHLRLTVKALGDGSRELQDLPVGTWVVAEGPYGAVTSSRRRQRNVLLIAGGVGITPMRALFESIPLAHGEDLLLLYRARRPEELLFRTELDAITARRGARLGYLLGDDATLTDPAALLLAVPDLVTRDVYMCGSPGFTAAVRAALWDAGLPPDHLHEERFG
jgi:predicted ferric reductase